MRKHSDKKVIYAALIGNSAIAIMKFIVAAISGSAAMLAEGFHSAADSGNQIMLLVGHARSGKPPDDRHPFGYGKELYFWAFVVAVSIFFVGAALSIYEGINKLIHPEPVKSIILPLVVLGLAMIFEAYPWWIAFSEARKIKTGKGFTSFMDMAVRSKNPTVLVVLFEDTAALIGLLVAAVGITLAYTTKMSIFDAIASILIGVVLLVLALFLARETKELLIGESAGRRDREKISQAICTMPEISQCGSLLTMHLGPDDILVNIDVEFVDGLSTDELEAAIDRLESRVKEVVPTATKIYIEAKAVKKKSAIAANPSGRFRDPPSERES
ncbi:MAG: cation diffusion facilitator family transporter [Syntrophobacterales bacterium]|jgi:cation diffusion facilitator family transporter